MTTLDTANTAVVVVDMQNDFVHPDGALYAPESEAAIEPVNELITLARDAGVPIAFTRDVHTEDQFDDAYYYDEFDRWGEHVVEGTWGAKIVDDTTTTANDFVIKKDTYNAFDGTNLDDWLTRLNVDDILLCGTLANVCVMHTAAGAGRRDYKPVVVEDALGYITGEHLDYATTHVDFLFGEVTDLDSIAFE